MSEHTVISCPRCMRQYDVDPTVKLARCGGCKSHFRVTIAELTLPCEAAQLDDPIIAHFNFLHEATAQSARNIRTIFELAGEPFTPESVVRFVKWLPRFGADLDSPGWREGYCSRVLERAYNTPLYIDRTRAHEAVTFFLGWMRTRSVDAIDTLVAAFAGVLSVDYSRTPGTDLAVVEKPKKRGPLERWAGRMGW